MSPRHHDIDGAIGRWVDAGLIDAATAARLRAHEQAITTPHTGRTARLAFGLGALLVSAGVFLFVAANWDLLSPSARFGTLTAVVAVLHLGGAFGGRFSPALAMALHAAGTAALGGGIFLAGQVFHLQEHWPEGLLLWAVGAAGAAALLRDWPQVLWLALLGPAWLAAEWGERVRWYSLAAGGGAENVLAFGLTVLAGAYLAAKGPGTGSAWRHQLSRLGGPALVLFAAGLANRSGFGNELAPASQTPTALLALGWTVAVGLPLGLAWLLRGRAAWPVAVVAVLTALTLALDPALEGQRLVIYVLYAVGSVGLVAWGFMDRDRYRVSLGVAAFALTVFAFYFSSLFDMLGRATGLLGLGLLFIGGGWLAERMRRRLIARLDGVSP